MSRRSTRDHAIRHQDVTCIGGNSARDPERIRQPSMNRSTIGLRALDPDTGTTDR